jgi:hypothetical protein
MDFGQLIDIPGPWRTVGDDAHVLRLMFVQVVNILVLRTHTSSYTGLATKIPTTGPGHCQPNITTWPHATHLTTHSVWYRHFGVQ